ncbi:FISUMP domain-containing protein [Mucilaginibacter sp. SP1R1]|uniref:FISUMP domain-containing protein n=1 Tax=Mucilaginibacter sp. SP1R1 TaxID=2723091 RepID=UPI00161952BF|nr:FISUMP domain-containing protein [Mucilaginibacter sp. SP1R1]MBB6148981.1 uncharacterized protein (TIGR02145 family) [Mucilaginibacter sp. SP1R1]
MKRHFYLLIIVALSFSACSKKNNNPIPPPKTTSVSISGDAYSTVVIGNQTWTSVNYSGPGGFTYGYGAGVAPITNYGKLYTMAEAKAIQLPTGWRLPTQADFLNLVIALGATQKDASKQDFSSYDVPTKTITSLMSKTGWNYPNGTNTSGFNALPAGVYVEDNSGMGYVEYSDMGSDCIIMIPSDTDPEPFVFGISSTQNGKLSIGEANINYNVSVGSDYRSSLRFVKDNK